MLTILFLSPVLIGVIAILLLNDRIRRQCSPSGRIALYGLVIAGAAVLPIFRGVWPPDFFGAENNLGSVRASTGHEISVVQRWNHRDFYTTVVRVRNPDGQESETVLDMDDSKKWAVSVALDESMRAADIFLGDGREATVEW